MKRQKVIFDVETTGLAPEHDEILQFSAINENGKVLLNTYIKPTHHSERFDTCSELIAYNFDFAFLIKAGIKFKPDIVISDPMIDFAEIYGEWNDYYGNYKYQKLTTAAFFMVMILIPWLMIV